MQSSINTTCVLTIHCLLRITFVARNMLRISLIFCIIATVIGIIVKDPPPSPNDYKYSYNIEDPATGDSKSQHEVRQGDVVTGAYSVVDPDGKKRIVEYTADSKHGFKAVVREEPAEIRQQLRPTIKYQNFSPIYRPILASAHKVRVPPSRYSKPQVYFTAANEIKSEDITFPRGQYFLPAMK